MLAIPRLSSRLDTFLWKLQFPSLIEDIKHNIAVICKACEQVRNSDKLAQLLKVILVLGGVLNRDNYLSSTSGFKIESLALVTFLLLLPFGIASKSPFFF